MQRNIAKKTKDKLAWNAENILKIQKATGREKQKNRKHKQKQMIIGQI